MAKVDVNFYGGKMKTQADYEAERRSVQNKTADQLQYENTGTVVAPTTKPATTTTTNPVVIQTPTVTAPSTPAQNQADIYKSYLDSILADYQAQMKARQDALEQQYQNSLGRLKESYDNSRTNMQNQSEDALRQSYINYMLGQRNVNQQLANQGVNGGMAESTLAEMYNNYGNSRNAIARNLNDNLSELASIYNNNVASLGNTYGSNIADVLSDYYDKATSAKASYASQIANALGKQATANAKVAGGTSEQDALEKLAKEQATAKEKARTAVVSTLSKYIDNPVAAYNYLNRFSDYTNEEKVMMLYEAGIDPNALALAVDSSAGSQPVVPTTTNVSTLERPIVVATTNGASRSR